MSTISPPGASAVTSEQTNISHISKLPSASFQPILDAALADYVKQIGIDPVNHPSVDQLRTCHSPGDVLKLLGENSDAFKEFREENRKLIDCLNPVVYSTVVLMSTKSMPFVRPHWMQHK